MKTIDDLLPILGFDTTEDFINGLKAYFLQQQYVWKDEQIIGFRMSDDYDNAYTDWLVVIKTSGTTQTVAAFQCSTKPGWTWLQKQAVATLKEGQRFNFWVKGTTSWSGDKYLQQSGYCTIYRDESCIGSDMQNKSIDRDSPIETGMFGINLHSWKGIGENPKVNNVSEGCQVMCEEEDAAAFEIINTFHEPINFTLIFTPAFLS